jgi:chaperonin GroES
MNHLRTLGDRILVEREDAVAVSKGGILIPDGAREKPQQGKVLVVGNGLKNDSGDRVPLDVNVDDVILFSKTSGMEVKLGDKTFVVLKEKEVLGVVTND